LADYSFELVYRPGKTQAVADCLSRPSNVKKLAAPVPRVRATTNGILFGEGIAPMIENSDPTNDDAEWNQTELITSDVT